MQVSHWKYQVKSSVCHLRLYVSPTILNRHQSDNVKCKTPPHARLSGGLKRLKKLTAQDKHTYIYLYYTKCVYIIHVYNVGTYIVHA